MELTVKTPPYSAQSYNAQSATHELQKLQVSLTHEELNDIRSSFTLANAERKRANDEKVAELQKALEKAQSAKGWGKIEALLNLLTKAYSAFATVAGLAGTAALGSNLITLSLTTASLLLSVDELFNDARVVDGALKKVASTLHLGPTAENILKFSAKTGLSTLTILQGRTVDLPAAISRTEAFIRAPVSALRGLNEYQGQVSEANISEKTRAIAEFQKKIDLLLEDSRKLSEDLVRMYQQMMDAQQNHEETAKQIALAHRGG